MSGSMDSVPTKRPTGRIILVDSSDRVLLIRSEDPRIDVPVLWLTPGGGCKSGESCAQAARRELYEETGIEVPDPGPCVWVRQHIWRWGERMIDSEEHFFFQRLDRRVATAPADLEEIEIEIFREFRWWRLDELLTAANEVFVPRRFAELLRPLLRGEMPAAPIDPGL
jgi:8-oxo-dGTP pyrophosphatase MutT (NUDIX family)